MICRLRVRAEMLGTPVLHEQTVRPCTQVHRYTMSKQSGPALDGVHDLQTQGAGGDVGYTGTL